MEEDPKDRQWRIVSTLAVVAACIGMFTVFVSLILYSEMRKAMEKVEGLSPMSGHHACACREGRE